MWRGDRFKYDDGSGAFAPPRRGSLGLDGPGGPLSEQPRNSTGHVSAKELAQFSGISGTPNFRRLTGSTPANPPFDANGYLVDRNGFGTGNGTRDQRTFGYFVA